LRSAVTGGQWPQVRVAKLYDEEVDLSCQLCHTATGTLVHRFVCPALIPSEGWGVLPRRVSAFISKIGEVRAHTLRTRGLLALRVRLVPPKPEGWFRWVVGGPERATEHDRWYLDGSFVDGPGWCTGRAGLAMVVVAPDGSLVACGLGSPPAWITNSVAAEGWALLEALRATPFPPNITTDCLGLIRQLESGLQDATSPVRPLARLWTLIAKELDGVVPENWLHTRFNWMPSHLARGAIGTTLKSCGGVVSPVDFRANRLADALAKLAALSYRAPRELRDLLKDAEMAVEVLAGQLGRVTAAANTFTHTAWLEDGTACTTQHRDSMAQPYHARGLGVRPGATGKRRTTSPTPAVQPPTGTSERAAAEETGLQAKLKWANGAKARASAEAAAKEVEAEARFTRTWLTDRAAHPAAQREGPTAAERLEAMRLRIRSRI